MKEVDATYFLSTIELPAGNGNGLARGAKRLFRATSQSRPMRRSYSDCRGTAPP